jgi:small subunit ribosomal protein S4
MARYTDAVCRLCRRNGLKLYLKGDKCFTKCTFDKRPQPPGDAPKGRRRKVSDRGLQLREKQKAKAVYMVLEKQFRHYYEEAQRREGITGENLVSLLETRLDNVVYRLGFADSRNQARQFVNHGLIAVNGRKVDIPSAQVRVGDQVSWSARGQKSEIFATIREDVSRKQIPGWVSLDPGTMTGRVLARPTLAEAGPLFNPNVIVEYYSR